MSFFQIKYLLFLKYPFFLKIDFALLFFLHWDDFFLIFYEILKKNNLNVKKITDQSEFLKKIGILERANILSKKMTFKAKANMFYRLKRLLDYKEMGSLFKVIFAQKKDGKFSLGF